MYNMKVGNDWVIHMLPEERIVVKGVERYSVRSRDTS